MEVCGSPNTEQIHSSLLPRAATLLTYCYSTSLIKLPGHLYPDILFLGVWTMTIPPLTIARLATGFLFFLGIVVVYLIAFHT